MRRRRAAPSYPSSLTRRLQLTSIVVGLIELVVDDDTPTMRQLRLQFLYLQSTSQPSAINPPPTSPAQALL